MKVKVDRNELLKKLSDIQNIVEKRNTMPVLNNFLLTAESTASTITATDLETAMKEPIEMSVLEEGRICIPAKKLFEIVREMDGEIVLESADNQWTKVKCGKSHFRLACISPDEFPVWPSISPEEAKSVELDAAVLLDAIEKTVYAAGESDTRYVLNGLLFHLKTDQVMNVIGTDGHRLALSEKAISEKLEEELKIIISRKSVAELRKFLDDEKKTVKLTIGKNHILFSVGSIQFLTRLIEGTYPNYEQVIPADNNKNLGVGREAFSKALKIVSILSKERSSAVKVDLTKDSMVISTSNPDLGDAKDEIPVKYSGDEMTIAFNARYLLDVLNVMEGENITLKMNEALSPVLVTEDTGTDYKCVVMPMRL
ncbi:MAG TPA: DNA polymerase III subunit beta [Dissulfurispiraceae bacterium]|nr:DNA polymerase III subunit beta [Dissulfurispiraceae bacterium]